jgi:peptide methionine sulfoxide reductase MsrA
LITKTDVGTQTNGFYYPSAKDIDILTAQNKQLQADREFKDRRPILTAISPGKGYWRQQMDHVCAHLKTYAVNRPDFRSLMGRNERHYHFDVHVLMFD